MTDPDITAPATIPAWVGNALVPLVNLLLALALSALVVAVLHIGDPDVTPLQAPLLAAQDLLLGAFGRQDAIGYTLFFTTNFIFTGLAVAVAFHAGLFNIGGEGQAYIGGLGAGLVCLYGDALPFGLLLPLAIAAAALFGAAWAAVPAWLQARRGSHIVITTIMFNFLASSLMVYLMVNVLIDPDQQSPESRGFAANAVLPSLSDLLGRLGLPFARSPLNPALLLALAAAFGVWLFLWRSRWGYALRVVGANPRAAVYAGIDPARVTVMAMMISGALAGLLGINMVMGSQQRLTLNFVGGDGFVGIAVALMGRNHPVGIVLAALLFGALYQGGIEMAFDLPKVTRDMVVVIQGLIILFAGALEYLLRPRLEALYRRWAAAPRRRPA